MLLNVKASVGHQHVYYHIESQQVPSVSFTLPLGIGAFLST